MPGGVFRKMGYVRAWGQVPEGVKALGSHQPGSKLTKIHKET